MNDFEKTENFDVEQNIEAQTADQEIDCPFCGEKISILDEVCPHCNTNVVLGDEDEDEFDLESIFPSQKRNSTSLTLEILAYVIAGIFAFMSISIGAVYFPQIIEAKAKFAETMPILMEISKNLFYGIVGFGVLKGFSFLTDDNF
jgi:hypothetical protein